MYLQLKPKNIREYSGNDSSITINSAIDYYQNKLAIKFNISDNLRTTITTYNYNKYYPIITKYGEENNFGDAPGSEIAYDEFSIIQPYVGVQWDYKDVVINKKFILDNNTDYYIVYNGLTKPYILNGFNLIVVGTDRISDTIQSNNYYYSNMISISIPDNIKTGQPSKITNLVYDEASRSVSFDLPNVPPNDPIISYTISRIISLGNKVSQTVNVEDLRVVNSRVGPIFLQDLKQIWNTYPGDYTYEVIANNSASSEPAYFSLTLSADTGAGLVDSWSIERAINYYDALKDPYAGINTNGSPNALNNKPTFQYQIKPPRFSWRVIPSPNTFQDSELELTVYPDPDMLTPATPIGPYDYSIKGYYNILPGWPGGEPRPSISCPSCPSIDKKSLVSVGAAIDLNTNQYIVDVLDGILPSGVATFSKSRLQTIMQRRYNDQTRVFYDEPMRSTQLVSQSISLIDTLPKTNQTIPFVKKFNRHELSNLAFHVGSGRFDIRASYGAIYQFTSTERYQEYGCPTQACTNRASTGKFFDRRFANKVIRSIGLRDPNVSQGNIIVELPYTKNINGSINKDIFEDTFRTYGKFMTGTFLYNGLTYSNFININNPLAQNIVNGTTDTSNNCVNCLGYNNSSSPIIMDLGAVMPISGVEIQIATGLPAVQPSSSSGTLISFSDQLTDYDSITRWATNSTVNFKGNNSGIFIIKPSDLPIPYYNSLKDKVFIECRYIYFRALGTNNQSKPVVKFKPLF